MNTHLNNVGFWYLHPDVQSGEHHEDIAAIGCPIPHLIFPIRARSPSVNMWIDELPIRTKAHQFKNQFLKVMVLLLDSMKLLTHVSPHKRQFDVSTKIANNSDGFSLYSADMARMKYQCVPLANACLRRARVGDFQSALVKRRSCMVLAEPLLRQGLADGHNPSWRQPFQGAGVAPAGRTCVLHC